MSFASLLIRSLCEKLVPYALPTGLSAAVTQDDRAITDEFTGRVVLLVVFMTALDDVELIPVELSEVTLEVGMRDNVVLAVELLVELFSEVVLEVSTGVDVTFVVVLVGVVVLDDDVMFVTLILVVLSAVAGKVVVLFTVELPVRVEFVVDEVEVALLVVTIRTGSDRVSLTVAFVSNIVVVILESTTVVSVVLSVLLLDTGSAQARSIKSGLRLLIFWPETSRPVPDW
jgi:hypothetical protein